LAGKAGGKEDQMDCIDHAERYRKHRVTIEEVTALFNTITKELKNPSKAVNGAVVFAMAGPEIEFALVSDYGMKGWNIKKDTDVLLCFMDPVGVVVIAGDGYGETTNVFRTFKGHEWAQKHAKEIIDQAENCLSLYSFE
jgi:hypothetical protein